ncbi:hypothetical protein Tco_1463522, partial [Tanacetum coccineum]
VSPTKVGAQGEAHTQQDQPEDHLRVLSAAERAVSTGSGEVSTASMVQEASTPLSVATKDKGKAIVDEEVALKIQEEFDAAERQRMDQVHQADQGFTDAEWDDVLARVTADEDFVQQLHAGEKCSEEDLPMKLVELVNQRKKFFA